MSSGSKTRRWRIVILLINVLGEMSKCQRHLEQINHEKDDGRTKDLTAKELKKNNSS
jgi:hypothetical protein